MKKLQRILTAARALTPQAEVKFKGTPNEEEWVCIISVGQAVLFESKPGTAEVIVDEATAKLKGMSTKMRAYLDSQLPPDPADPPSKKEPSKPT